MSVKLRSVRPATAGCRMWWREFSGRRFPILLFVLELVAAFYSGTEEPLPYTFQAGAPLPLELGIERVHPGNQRYGLRQDQGKRTQGHADEKQHFFVGVGR